MRKLVLHFCLLITITGNSLAHFDARYEPPDGRVIHGMGQYISFIYSVAENWQHVTEYRDSIGEIPLIYSAYATLDPFKSRLDSTDFFNIIANHWYPYILLVGLDLLDSTYLVGNTNIPVQNILNGDLDYRIVDIANRLKVLGVPVYFRPAFEFGSGNSGMHNDPDMGPSEFKSIWYHIYSIFQQENVTNVAWVWNTVNPNAFSFMDWYPGDDYVDWWGINWFTASQIDGSTDFIAQAFQHQKPVMICESAPITHNGTANEQNWNDWFIPYFNKIKNNPHIKAFIYISDPWDRGPFSSWPDSRISSNETIAANYQAEMQNEIYIHMEEYLRNPGIINDTLFPPVTNFVGHSGNNQVQLNWVNPSYTGFAGVRILRKLNSYAEHSADGTMVYQGEDTVFIDSNLQNGMSYFYSAYAYDLNQNYSRPMRALATPGNSSGIIYDEKVWSDSFIQFRNYPNPFNSQTTFIFNILVAGSIELAIYNTLGQKVAGIRRSFQSTEPKKIIWNAADLPSGVYIAELLNADRRSATLAHSLKLLLLK